MKFLKLNSFNAIIFLSQIQARSICKNPTNAKKFHWHLLAIFFRLVKNNVIPFPMCLLRHYLSLHFAVRPRLARKFCIHFHFGEKNYPVHFLFCQCLRKKEKCDIPTWSKRCVCVLVWVPGCACVMLRVHSCMLEWKKLRLLWECVCVGMRVCLLVVRVIMRVCVHIRVRVWFLNIFSRCLPGKKKKHIVFDCAS